MHCPACTYVIGQRGSWHFVGAQCRLPIKILEIVQHKYLGRRCQLDRPCASFPVMAGCCAPKRVLASRRDRAARRP
jgi:hypothetical protein